MITRRSLVPFAATLLVMANPSTAIELGHSCVVNVEEALTHTPKTTDIIPLAEGTWVGDTYVMPYSYPESYDRHLTGGIDNVEARQWVAQSFFTHNPDSYDFIVVVSDFVFDAGWGQHGDPTHALYWAVQNDTAGIGLGFFDQSQLFGSRRLQGYIDTNSLDLVRDSLGILDEEHFLTIVSHELGHRWLAHCDYEDTPGSISSALRGVDDTHWSYLLDSNASYMYGSDWQDNENGSFTATEIKTRYSDLDLYLMGMLPGDEVDPVTLLTNPAIDADQYPELGAIIDATPTLLTVDQVIAAEGPRIPSNEDSPHEFKIAVVYLATPGDQVTAEKLQFLTTTRTNWQRRFFAQTDGRGVIGVGRNSMPVVSPPTVDLAAAVSWLVGTTGTTGLWADHPITTGRDTAAAIAALDAMGGFEAEVDAALGRLAASDHNPTEIDAWRAEALAHHDHPESGALLDQLLLWILDDGAWGGGLRYAGDTVTTARVVRALGAGDLQPEAEQALVWILDRQNDDGGWPWRIGGPSAMAPTLEIVLAAVATDPQNWALSAVQDALSWLLAKRSQGGFGDPHPNPSQTASFLASVNGQATDHQIVEDAIAFLAAQQRSDGSWGGSVYQTAMAVSALAPYVQPDLAVFPTELLVEPEDPFTEDQLTLTAAAHSLRGDVSAGIPYRWEVLDSAQAVVATLDGVLPPIPATLFATVTDTWDLRHHVQPGTYAFRFSVDPLHDLAESNEGNNTAETQVTFRDHAGWIDLELSPDAVQATPSTINSVPQTVVIEGVIRNTGHTDAVNAALAVFETGSPVALATTSVTVQRNGETAFQLTIQIDEARPYELTLIADPDSLLNDADPSNNRIDLDLPVAPVFDPAVVAGSLTISPVSGVQAGDLVTIGFDLVNSGTQPVSSLQVGISFTAGDPPTTTAIQLMEITAPLNPGETRTTSIDWRPPVADPNLIVTTEVDPFHLVDDTDRSNNTTEAVFAVAPSLLPNLVASHTGVTFDPEPALQNSIVHISAAVVNASDNASGPFVARLWMDEIGVATPIVETVIPSLDPGASGTVETDWIADEMNDRLVWLEVDPDDQVVEFDEGDNQDFKILDVQSIPDLVVTSGQVSFNPRFPHTGDVVQLEVTVVNIGDQTAASTEVRLEVVDGPIVDSIPIPGIAGGESETVVFDWATGAAAETISLRITVDPADTVTELDEDNNVVMLDVAVQDTDLWVTERYISPNGDGVQDSTQVFVREGIDQIDVVDPWGEVVRVLTASPPGSTEWDGRKDNGAVARDGVYELRAGGLVSWVEVDLNGVTVTDNIRQPLITRNVSPTSSHPMARFTSYALSPVDGIVYLAEHTSSTPGDFKVRRWNGEHLESIPDWPDDHWHVRQASSDGSVFLTWALDYTLIRFPGPQVEPLTRPSYGFEPHLSPDGEWILWERPFISNQDNIIVLQRVEDLGEVIQFGPYTSTSPYDSRFENTVDFAPGGSRVVVGAHFTRNEHIVLDIELGETPTVREVPLEQSCWSIQDTGQIQMVFAAVDFDHNLMTCVRDQSHELYTIDLRTGSTLETTELPLNGDSTETWYRLSNDGRVVEVDKYVIPLLKRGSTPPYFLFDWNRGLTEPWFTGLYGSHQPIWSSRDRYSYNQFQSGGSDHFTYRTPAANLAVTLNPVVRFGGAGIDLFLTVTDKNLDHFRIEYAPAAAPDSFEPLGQPARDTLLGENWGTWIPPEQGTWRVRLTAVDLAGNERSVARWVTWNGVSDIAGLWTESRHISPVASPGVQDEMVWQYTVLRPSQLLFEIVDSAGELIRSIPVGANETGPRTTTWDGLDDAGGPVPDGEYTLSFRGAEWPVTVDNTPPDTTLEIAPNDLRPSADEIDAASQMTPPMDLERSAIFNRSSHSVADANLDRAIFETRHVDQSTWGPVGDAHFADMTESESRDGLVRSEWWPGRILRLVANDRAGNTSVVERLHREEELGIAFAEPPCRSDDQPCIFPDRPDINTVRDADGLMNDDVAVLWPEYSTFFIQSTVWGEWRSTLQLEFRVPGEGGLPPGDWQPGTILASDNAVWRRVIAPTDNPVIPFANYSAQVLPIYWEHPGLPLRPYEVRVLAENRDGDVITGSTVLVVPKAPLAIEYLSSDASGDHFRVHNLSTDRIDDISLLASTNGVGWIEAATIGSLDPGLSVLVNTGCGLLDRNTYGGSVVQVKVTGVDPWDAPQSSLPSSLPRGGPPDAASAPNLTLIREGCGPNGQPPMGMMGYDGGGEHLSECRSWGCEFGWFSPGSLVDLQIAVPDTDPTGTAVSGYELLIDGSAVAGVPDFSPGTTGRVTLDLSGLAEGDHVISERYLFAPGEDGMLSSCFESTTLHVNRSAPAVAVTNPSVDQVLCPDQDLVPIEFDADDSTWQERFTIDGSTTGITTDPVSLDTSISVSALDPGPHTLEATIIDLAGNATCLSVPFSTEGIAVATDLEAVPPVFSPTNTSGRPTETIVSFSTTAAADYTIEILDNADSPIAVSEGTVVAGETVSLVWDGREAGEPVPDGNYRIKIRLVSDCGAVYETQEPLPRVTVDTTPPVMVVTRPYPGSTIITAVEIQALMTDPNFESWEARIRSLAPLPGDWQVFASGIRPSTDPENVIARWATAHLSVGDYEIEVEAMDDPGNLTVASVPVLIIDPQLIASFRANPIYISPNGDGAADEVIFSFELLLEAEVSLSFEGWIDLIESQALPPSVPHTATWNGHDPDQNPAPDGPYQFELRAYDDNEGAVEAEFATVIVDREAPSVEISSPPNGILTALPISVSGFSSDPHADDHLVILEQPDGTTNELAAAPGDWPATEFFTLDDLPDGEFRIRATATDLAENTTTVEHAFTIDNTAPSARITAPTAGQFLDPNVEPLILQGVIAAGHPESFSWWIAEGTSPETTDFIMVDEQVLPAAGPVEYGWAGPPPADGVHTIRLTLTDQLGRSSEDRRIFTIDADNPVAELWTPTESELITEPTTITGLVDDPNLTHWTLEEITNEPTVRLLAAGSSPVQDELIIWDPLPPDGPVTLRLTAHDLAGHITETSVEVEVSVLPPGAPVDLSAEIAGLRDVALSWLPGPGPSPVGYHIERDGTRITATPVPLPSLVDSQVLDGVYTYKVTAIGPHGRESEPSEPATIVVNRTPPETVLTSPTNGSRVGAEVTIFGTAFSSDDFGFWEIDARAAGTSDWVVIESSVAPVIGGLMTTWVTLLPPWSDGEHELRLAAEDVVGNRAESQVSVFIDNTAPDPGPVNLEAALTALDPDRHDNDVQLTWIQNPNPSDLAGFYLYRNGLLANAPGPVIGDPSPYLLSDTSFDDRDVADGTYIYGVAAADTAGNVSALSNPAGPITIDTRRPHAVITSPADGTEIEVSVEVVVECDDEDVVSLNIQYRLESQPGWDQMVPTFTSPPYSAIFSPSEHGLYFVRALAADAIGPDPSPHIVEITAADLPPEAPLQLTASAAGDHVTLSWIAPPDPGGDLAGYDLERNGIVVNADLLPPETQFYLDAGLADGSYDYRIIAVDHSEQRTGSEPVTISIHTPFWDWVTPVATRTSVTISGGAAHSFGAVEIQAFTPDDGTVATTVLEADGTGSFEIADVPLGRGVNSFTAMSTDDNGNTSRVSLPLLLVANPPPLLVGDLRAESSGNDVTLTWSSTEAKSAGFEVSRSGSVINEIESGWPHDSVAHAVTASSADPISWPLVVDGDPSTGWTPELVPSPGRPEWWAWEWSETIEIDEMIVGWSTAAPPQTFDIDVLTPGGWLWLTNESWGGQPTISVPVGLTATGVRIRIPETGACGTAACLPMLSAVDLGRRERTIADTYIDEGLADGVHSFEVRERNIWGQWSYPAGTSAVIGPDQPLPPSDLTVNTLDCGGLEVQWQPASTQPGTLFAFRIYRRDAPWEPYSYFTTVSASQPTVIDYAAPVGIERFYVVTSFVNMGGVAVESIPSLPASGTASCTNPPPPVITEPTIAGLPILITPSQIPVLIRGTAVSGSTLTLLHNSNEVRTQTGYPNFTFSNVDVHPGINTYSVRQALLGNITESAPIEIELDSSLVPDAEAISLTMTPIAAAPGEFVMAEGAVELHASIGDTAAFDVAFELTNPAGMVSEIYRTTLLIAAGDTATVRAPWTAGATPGIYNWRFVVDPGNDVMELDESNNVTTSTCRVLDAEGLELDVRIDRSSYLVGQQLTGSVFFASSEEPENYLLETRLEDSSGRLVTVLDSRSLAAFGGSWLEFDLDHPLVDLYPGLYRIRTLALVDGLPAVEATAPFQLEQPIFVEAEVSTDRSTYPEGIPVGITGRIHNLGPAFIEGLSASLSVVDEATGHVIAENHATAIAIAAGGTAEVLWNWPTSGALPGPYRATLTVFSATGSPLSVAEPFAFTVVPGDIQLMAVIELSASPVEPGHPVTASVAITNTGSADLPALDLTIALIDPIALEVVDEYTHSMSLAAGAAHHIDQPLVTTSLAIQRYVVFVRASGDDGRGPFSADLGSITLEVADLSPPDVLITEPSADGVACEEVVIEAEVVDSFSRIDRVYHHLDDETTALPLYLRDSATDPNTYTANRALPSGEDGPHLITVFAEDAAGNLSTGDSVTFDTDTIAPVLQVIGPSHGSCSSGGVSFVYTATDDHLVSTAALLDGGAYPSGGFITTDGAHILEVTAMDACDREASETRSFVIDSMTPEIHVTGVTQGSQVAPGTVLDWWVDDANPVIAAATLNGISIDPSVVLNTTGAFTLHITATDCADNTADLTVEFSVTEATVALAGGVTADPSIIEPAQVLDVSGQVTNSGSDLTAIELTLSVVRNSSGLTVVTHSETTDLLSGQAHTTIFSPDTSDWELGLYEIRFTARGFLFSEPYDLVLGTATLTTADLTPPQLSVLSPSTGLTCSAIEVMADATDNLTGVSSVTVAADGGPALPMTHTSGSTWSIPLPLDEGLHQLRILATDGGGNLSAPIAIDIDQDTESPQLSVTAPGDGSCLGEETTIEFSADDPHLNEVSTMLNGSPISSGHVIDGDGAYSLEVIANDTCGHQTSDTRDFVIDTTAPEITVTGLGDDEVHAVGIPGQWSATDDNLESASATLDGTPVDQAFTVATVGLHVLEATAVDCADNSAAESIAFQTVAAEDGLSGVLGVDPLQLEPPTTLQANATATNLIDTDYFDVTLRLEVTDSSTGAVVRTHETVTDLLVGTDFVIDHEFTTDDLGLGEHELRFSAAGTVFDQPFIAELVIVTFEVVDQTPPALSFVTPSPGLVCESVEVRVTANDALSGVGSVELQIDADPVGLPLAHLGGNQWSIDLTLPDGGHQLEVSAIDASGNQSAPTTLSIDLDLTPPDLSVSAPVDGTCLADSVVITFDAEDDHLEHVTARLDGAPIVSGALISVDGDHSLWIAASDLCSHTDFYDGTFVIDTAPPTITITGVADGGEFAPPVDIGWLVTDANLIGSSALLDGDSVEPPLRVDATGTHVLIIDAKDCAGNTRHTEVNFTVVDDPASSLVVDSVSLDAGGSILLLDRSPSGVDLEPWIADRVGRVVRTTDVCIFVSELRRSMYEAVVLYAPTGSAPLDLSTCSDNTDLPHLAAELGATAFRQRGILVIGEGMEGNGCLGCAIRATGTSPGPRVLDRIDVQTATSILGSADDTTIFDLRPIELVEGFPTLLEIGGGASECDGLAAVTLEFEPNLEGPWTVAASAFTPHENLDQETGALADGETLNASSHRWVDLSAARRDDTLEITLRSALGGALPDWISLETTVEDTAWGTETSAWLPISCDLGLGEVFDMMEVTAVETIDHDVDRTVAASARRYGRGEALVLPWDVLAPANADALPLVEQALAFTLPGDPWPAIAGLPLPLSITLRNEGSRPLELRLEATVSAELLLEAWNNPQSLSPVRWEIAINAGSSATRTLWVLPDGTSPITMPFTVSIPDGDEWTVTHTEELEFEVDVVDHRVALRELRTALADCAESTHDPAVQTTLRDVLAALERTADAGNDSEAATQVLRELAGAFADSEDVSLPCLAELREEIADLMALWQARWTMIESSP